MPARLCEKKDALCANPGTKVDVYTNNSNFSFKKVIFFGNFFIFPQNTAPSSPNEAAKGDFGLIILSVPFQQVTFLAIFVGGVVGRTEGFRNFAGTKTFYFLFIP